MNETEMIEKISKNTQEIRSIHETLDRHEDKLEKLQNEASAIDKLNYILDESRKTNERTAETLNSITNTLTKMNLSIETTNRRVEELSKGQDDIRNEMKSVNERIETVDDKTKFDWAGLITKTLIPILLSGGIVYLILNLPK